MKDSQFQVILEDVNHKLDSIVEVVNDHSKRFVELDKKIDIIQDDIHQLKDDMSIVKLSLPNKANVADLEKVKSNVNIINKKLNLKGA